MTAKRSGPPARISKDMIEQAVVDVGFHAASTTSVARRLGVDQSSLYRHIGSKEELMLGAIDRVLTAQDWEPDAADWQSYLRAQAETFWDVLRRHTGLAAQLYALDAVPPASTAIMIRGVRVLRGFGWSVPDAVLLLDTISDMTGDTINQLEATERAGRRSLEDLAEQYAADETSGDDALERQVREHIAGVLRGDPKQWWLRKLDLIIGGAERLRELRAAEGPGPGDAQRVDAGQA